MSTGIRGCDFEKNTMSHSDLNPAGMNQHATGPRELKRIARKKRAMQTTVMQGIVIRKIGSKSGFFVRGLWPVIVLLALVLASLESPAIAQENDALRWKFAAGDRFDVTLKQDSEVRSFLTLNSIEDRNKTGRTATSSLTLKMDWNVDSLNDDGDAVVQQMIAQIQLTADTGARTGQTLIEIDTAVEEKRNGIEASLQKQMLALVGLSFEVTMSPRGEVIDVVIPEETLEALRQIPGSMQVRNLMSAEGLKDLYGQAGVVLPEGELAEGESWSVESPLQTTMGDFTRSNQYTLESTSSDDGRAIARFAVETTVASGDGTPDSGSDEKIPDAESAGEGAERPTRLVEFSGTGTMVMNIDDGYFVSSQTSNQLKSEKDYFDQTIVTSVNSRIEMQIEKVAR